MNSRNYEEHIYYILDHFTKGGTPLPALIGNKLEWQVTTLVAGLLANEHVSTGLEAEQIVDAAINYVNIIQQRLGHYQESKINTLEGLLDKN
jgi:hypothetical protein|tara:strand:+ start:851 stop:1126 length:276 start_codon:yes stop_codon:yes gene_type:complete